jgi:pimeloyl-ACP methyl ester carboxylesterase
VGGHVEIRGHGATRVREMRDRSDIRAGFVKLSSGAPAALYEPVQPEDRGRVAFVFMHPDSGFISHLGCEELAARGFRVLGVNTRFANMPGPTGGPYVYHEVLPDVAAAVAYLRTLPGLDTIVLAGHSGGGPLFSAYQNLAENGVEALRGESLIERAPLELDGVPPADALVLLDGHVGYGAQALLTLDPSVVDEEHPSRRDPALDMFEARNGYEPGGSSFSAQFVAEFNAGQARRMSALVEHARSRVAAIDAGRGEYPDDEPMVIAGIGAARIWSLDNSLLARTSGSWPLLRGDGTEVTGVVPSVRARSGRPEDQRSYTGVLVTSVRRFLATHAVRATGEYLIGPDFLRGIDWHSSYTSAPANLEGVHVPLLSLAMSAHYFLVPNEVNFAHSASADKQMAMVEGATHGMTPASALERRPGEFGDTVARVFDHVAKWTDERFGS